MKKIIIKSRLRNSVLLTFLSAGLLHCGFGGKNADPMKDQDRNSYVSKSEKGQENKSWKEKFQEETDEYNKSLKEMEKQSDDKIKDLQVKYTEMEKLMSEQMREGERQCQSTLSQLTSDFNNYKTEQDQVIVDLKASRKAWEDKATSCENYINNPDVQKFQGIIHKFEMEDAMPQTLEWIKGQSKSYEIKFELDVGNEAVTGLDISPDLPTGLSLGSNSDGKWVIEGMPQVSFSSNEQNQWRQVYTLSPRINFDKIKDETIKTMVKQQDFSESFMIVVQKTEAPSVTLPQMQVQGDSQ